MNPWGVLLTSYILPVVPPLSTLKDWIQLTSRDPLIQTSLRSRRHLTVCRALAAPFPPKTSPFYKLEEICPEGACEVGVMGSCSDLGSFVALGDTWVSDSHGRVLRLRLSGGGGWLWKGGRQPRVWRRAIGSTAVAGDLADFAPVASAGQIGWWGIG